MTRSWRPNPLAYGGAAVLGLVALVGAMASLQHGLPHLLALAMGTFGLVQCLLCWGAIGGSRAAWSFLVSVVAISAVLTFLGSTKVAHALGVPLAAALILPLTYVAVAILLNDNGAKPS